MATIGQQPLGRVAIMSKPAITFTQRETSGVWMTDQLLIRKVPRHVRSWIEKKRVEHGMTQQEFIVSILEHAFGRGELPLFQPAVPKVNATAPDTLPFKFSDFFAGIGGFRTALQTVGGDCVYSCEWDKYSQKTYKAWYGDTPAGDIRKVEVSDIPVHDVLAGGFPCQPFSIAGVSKKRSLGHAHGFKCETQGNLFFQLATIIEQKRPPVAFLENVKNLTKSSTPQGGYRSTASVSTSSASTNASSARTRPSGFQTRRQDHDRSSPTFSNRTRIRSTRSAITYGSTSRITPSVTAKRAMASASASPTPKASRGH
jgi:hypothetical protein